MAVVKQYEIYFVNLDPTVGAEVKKTRPAVVISPDEMNRYLRTVIIAPITSSIKNYPSRVSIMLQNRQGQIMLDQIRAIDKTRLTRKVGKLNPAKTAEVKNIIREMLVD